MLYRNLLRLTIIIICSFAAHYLKAQTSWVLKKDKDAIRIYTRDTDESEFKSVKVTCIVPGTLSQLTALLLDVGAHKSWVYNTKTSYLVNQPSPNQQIYYSQIDLPWPLADREVVVFMNIVQDPVTKVLHVTIDNAVNNIPIKNGTVRVPASSVTWNVTALPGKRLNIEYYGQVDPGGSVPGWAANPFTTKGPFETFRRLRQIMTSPSYANATFDFIKE